MFARWLLATPRPGSDRSAFVCAATDCAYNFWLQRNSNDCNHSSQDSVRAHAHLYLEDVEEICKILLDAFSRPSTSQPTILFSLGDDLQMDSIDDLERRGGSAKILVSKLSPTRMTGSDFRVL